MMSSKSRPLNRAAQLSLITLFLALAGCGKTEQQQLSAKAFANPDDAANALVAAAKSGDTNAVLAILGPNAKEILSSGDAVQDKEGATAFVARYTDMHRWREMHDGSEILLIGTDNFPFPIPIKKNSSGQWQWDTAAGKEEVLNRRVGRNELAAIDICQAIEGAQAEYFSKLHDGSKVNQYATKFISDAGKQNGLYWPVAEGQPQSPLGPMVANATAEGYTKNSNTPTAFHGYFFRMLNSQSAKAPSGAKEYLAARQMAKGFAVVAYPAEYGNSGVMTFMINQDGLLLEKDLGKSTTEIATKMTQYDPDNSWKAVQQ
jgi:hypothetical protein